jgi:hypothetical protein
MKKSIQLIICFALCISNQSCGQFKKEKQTTAQDIIKHNGQTYVLKKSVIVEQTEKSVKSQPKVIFHRVQDRQRNMLLGYMPLPEDWKILDRAGEDNEIITGPNDIKVFAALANYYTYSDLPGMNQMSTQAGQQVKPLMSVESFVKNELEPMLSKEGARLIKQYHLPELQKYAENYDQFTFKSVPMQTNFKAYATEWEHDDGEKLLLIINYRASYSDTGVYWGYYSDMMGAPTAHFEKAKKDYIYALANQKYNPQWLQTCYMEEAQKAAQRGELHQQRMAALRAEGQAIIERGKVHSAQVDASHKKWMDAHLDRTTVSSGGQSYQVDGGANEYWINANGEYISSNNYNYDPNTDNSVNNQSWTKTTIQN